MTSTRNGPTDATPAAVRRWELAGGEWTVLHVQSDRAVVELRQCDGGTVAELLTLKAADEIHWARKRLTAATEI